MVDYIPYVIQKATFSVPSEIFLDKIQDCVIIPTKAIIIIEIRHPIKSKDKF